MAKENDVQDAELGGLTADERAALEESAEDVEALKAIAGEEDDEPDDIDDGDGDDDEEEDKGGASDAGKAADAQPASAEPTPEEAEDESGAFLPTYKVDPVENFDQRMTEFSEQKKTLREQLNNGDLSVDEYEEKKDAIIVQEQQLREQNLKFQIAMEQNQQNARARWEWEQEMFFETKSNAIYKGSKLLMAALDTAVKDLANKPKNASRTGSWFLKEADRQVRDTFNLTKAAAPDKPVPNGKDRKPDLTGVPKTLSGLPNAEMADTGSDEFSHLENLDGLELERALAKMSSEDAARYLGAAA